MEALHGVSATLLTVYDMSKAVSKEMEIKNIHLVSKVVERVVILSGRKSKSNLFK